MSNKIGFTETLPVNGNLESGEVTNPEVFSATVLGGFLHHRKSCT